MTETNPERDITDLEQEWSEFVKGKLFTNDDLLTEQTTIKFGFAAIGAGMNMKVSDIDGTATFCGDKNASHTGNVEVIFTDAGEFSKVYFLLDKKAEDYFKTHFECP